MILLVGGAVVIGDLLPTAVLQVAQQQVNGREAADAVAVLHGGDLLVEAGSVALQDGVDERLVGLLESSATRCAHGEAIAESGTDVGQVYRGDGKDFEVLGFALQGLDNGRQACIFFWVTAVGDKVVEGAAQNGHHWPGCHARFLVNVMQPNR